MTSESPDSLYDSVYKSLQEKDTEELLEIWQQNDRNEWSDKDCAVELRYITAVQLAWRTIIEVCGPTGLATTSLSPLTRIPS